MKTVMSGGEPLLDDEQAQQVAQAFDKHLQAKQQEEQARQMAEREAQAKTNASEGKTFPAAHAAKAGVTTTEAGLHYQVLAEGTGPKRTADDIRNANYKTKMLAGTQFDSPHARGAPTFVALQPGAASGDERH